MSLTDLVLDNFDTLQETNIYFVVAYFKICKIITYVMDLCFDIFKM